MNAIVDPSAFVLDWGDTARLTTVPGSRPLLLIVDDNPDNLLLLGELLEPDYELRFANSGVHALTAACMVPQPSLVLLDMMMPGMDGLEVMARLQNDPLTAAIPVVFVTARDGAQDEERGLQAGAVDYVTKPINPLVLTARIRTHLELKRTRDLLARQNASLEAEVASRLRDIHVVKHASLRALASLGETRDCETGQHILRTQLYIEVLGRELQDHPRFRESLSHTQLRLIVEAAPLHDIGKIGIPDAILLKPGPLTPEEFEAMKSHAALGGQALDRAVQEARRRMRGAGRVASEDPLEFLLVARDIALGHHEKWDGSGYPSGLAGDAIPVSARLMALADVFDALISRRVYKPALPIDEVSRIIVEGRGRHFDPDIVDAFVTRQADFVDIANRHRDAPPAA